MDTVLHLLADFDPARVTHIRESSTPLEIARAYVLKMALSEGGWDDV